MQRKYTPSPSPFGCWYALETTRGRSIAVFDAMFANLNKCKSLFCMLKTGKKAVFWVLKQVNYVLKLESKY
ncbi:MAG: hypothetical protein IMZ61_08985 [Planctomycetes bacterium]|nr:hypothetical protein [Planctomycetota bacterium]